MTSSISNPGNFLRTSRNFPTEIQPLTVELNKMYVDIANQVNNRISGIFGPSQIVTSESWFLSGPSNRQQTLRQVYPFSASGSIPHNLNWNSVFQISPKSYGSYTDGTNDYGVIFGTSVAIAGQLSFYVTPTNIVVLSGAAAPSITSGLILLEWITQV